MYGERAKKEKGEEGRGRGEGSEMGKGGKGEGCKRKIGREKIRNWE